MRSFHSRAVGGQRGQLDHILVIGRIFWTLDTPYKGIQASLRGGRNVSRRNLSQEEMELLERAQGRRGPRRSKNAVFRVIGSGVTDSISRCLAWCPLHLTTSASESSELWNEDFEYALPLKLICSLFRRHGAPNCPAEPESDPRWDFPPFQGRTINGTNVHTCDRMGTNPTDGFPDLRSKVPAFNCQSQSKQR